MNKTIIAIDPGNVESAFVNFDGSRVLKFGKIPNHQLREALCLPTPGFDTLVIERIACMGMSVGDSVFETVFWSGRFAEAWLLYKGREFHRIKRGEVKMHLCQTMRAKDGNIRQALIDKLGPQGTKTNPGPTYGISGDCWAALAVAVTFYETTNQLTNSQNA